MQAVGRLGSYISKGVYTVSGPFHPFGGAVDIIVVQQPDGSYKSSPWYVRFGKFQGVLKTREKVVNICVNGIETDFHMYLDHKGEAFFLKDVDVEEIESLYSPPSSSGEDTDRKPRNGCPLKSRSCNYDSNTAWSRSSEFELNKEAVLRSSSRRAQFLGAVFGRRSSRKDDVVINEEDNMNGVIRTESLERAEMAADLLDLKWSTNLLSSRRRRKDASHFPPIDVSKDEVNKNSQVDVCNSDGMDLISDSVHQEMDNGDSKISLMHEEQISVSECLHGASSEKLVAESYSQSVSVHPLNDSSEILECENVVCISSSETKAVLAMDEPLCNTRLSKSDLVDQYVKALSITEEEQLLFGNLDDPCSTIDETNESTNANCCSSFTLDQSIINDYIDNVTTTQKTRLRNVSSDVCLHKTDHGQSKELSRMARSLPASLTHNLEASDCNSSSDSSCSDAKARAYNSHSAPLTAEDVRNLRETLAYGNLPPCNSSLRGSQKRWPFPFRKSKGVKVSNLDDNISNGLNPTDILQNSGNLEGTKVKTNKKKVRTLTPTSEQLASLNLKEGKNTVVFTFSTSMLGKQQVDARIFLWRWDTRIVISDVDGTITRSDLLGQVMPLVGMDWSQTGVAHLFSAIKENGYEMLFLSARSISQSFITRQFLFNIKQDGKALPEGPVVISPDGLFPSLFREVVRRAPHEFKIACLEDIKALFPADTNPFYAGFGNRDTDEFSYLKVGIPRGKIFIINPKGDIVVNRRVSKKSYSSLHALVHGMFPSMSSSEQEDFNSWNYWKLPPLALDL